MGGPKDKFIEEDLQKEENAEDLDDEIDDVTVTSIIELFADEKDGYYYGKGEKIGSREECIKWIKSILRRDLEL